MTASTVAPRKANGQLQGRKKGEGQPKDPCPGCGTYVTRGRPGKQHTPGADGHRPCEAQAADRAAAASTPPVERPSSGGSYGLTGYEDLDALEKAAAGDATGPEDPSAPPAAPAGPSGAPPPATFADLAQLADPMVVWGGAADFLNNVQESMTPTPSQKWRINMTPTRAEALQRGLYHILPAILVNKYAFFAFGLFFTFGLPMLGAFGESRKLAAAEKKRAAPPPAAAPAGGPPP